MTGDDLRKARATLGRMWGWERPAFASELGRALGNPARDPGQLLRGYEARRDEPIPWFIATPVEMMLKGVFPPDGVPLRLYDKTVKRSRRSKRLRQAA